MAGDEKLIPFFMPPLAMLLAKAEADKTGRLTESKVKQVRDRAVCIMMSREHVEEMVQSRGYRDVNAQDCWADWHRLRVEFTGNGYLPKIVLCVVGGAKLSDNARPLLEAAGVEHEWSDRNPRMITSFEASACRCDPSFQPEDLAGIASHSRVLYVLSKNFTAKEGPGVSRAFLRLGARLLEAGGVALKCESAGIAHGRARWLELAREAENEHPWSELLRAFVQLPIFKDDDYHTCGMHLLGRPDLIVSAALLRKLHGSGEDPAWKAVDLLRVFARYLLGECAEGAFASGHTFSAAADSPRYRVLWEECTGYEENDFFYNSFGRWRFTDASSGKS